MSKRYGKDFDKYQSSPAKKAKIENPRVLKDVLKEKKQSIAGVARSTSDDVWGDDFDDNAIEELDFVASQACSQDVNVSMDSRANSVSRVTKAPSNFQPVASTSRSMANGPTNRQILKLKDQSRSTLGNKITSTQRNNFNIHSQKLASSDNITDIADHDRSIAFDEFKTNLLGRGHLNSTFDPRNDVVIISGDARLRHIEKLEQENKKLLDDFMIKEGETVFLRNQLQQTVQRAENERAERERLMEEQASRYRAEINALHKEKDGMKTQHDFQSLQLGSLMERCKLLETGSVKLTTPQKAVITHDSPSRSRLGSLNRSVVTPKAVKLAETSVQTSDLKKSCWDLKTVIQDHPLSRIPQTVFEPSLPEKSVVDIQIVEKFGKKNLPILQEEDTFRIFENPDLVKPLVSVVDGNKLDVKYFMPEIAVIMRMTSTEINSKDCIPIVNKIVSTTRELFLNSTVVLQTISSAMKNDDVRDMNDLYFSDFYDTKIGYDKNMCDSNVWYDTERGIESRRCMGTLSYIAEESIYLSEYIAGKTQLLVDGDESYTNYEKQMIRYRGWEKKGHDFELLEMILEFVTALGYVRRSHQFSGMIFAIARTLSSVQKKIGFCPRGLQYVTNIFKELVFSRPLARCFIPMTEMMKTFCKSSTFGQKLCFTNTTATSLSNWKGELHFTPDACPLEIYVVQLERFPLDPLTMVDISDSFLSFVHLVFLSNSIPWEIDSSNPCSCCMRLLIFTITLLCNCSKIDLKTIELQSNRLKRENAKFDENFWRRVRRKQLNALRKGIRFLSYLAKRDPDFIIRVSDTTEDSFYLFMQRVNAFDDLIIHGNEQEALALIKSTLMSDKSAPSEKRSQQSQKIFRVRSAFQTKTVPSPSSGKFYNVKNKISSQQSIAVYRDLLKG